MVVVVVNCGVCFVCDGGLFLQQHPCRTARDDGSLCKNRLLIVHGTTRWRVLETETLFLDIRPRCGIVENGFLYVRVPDRTVQ